MLQIRCRKGKTPSNKSSNKASSYETQSLDPKKEIMLHDSLKFSNTTFDSNQKVQAIIFF